MSASRRGFLQGLAGLPLIGGGVALIGQPTASATPVTDQLLDTYNEWLNGELVDLVVERTLAGRPIDRYVRGTAAFRYHHPMRWGQPRPATWQPASARAAVVLSAVGCPWEGGR